MALTRWDPFGEVLPLRQMMDRLLEDAFIQPGRMFGNREGTGDRMSALAVSVDLAEHENELTVTASLPGVRPEDVDISIQNDVLTIQGEVREEREQPSQTSVVQQGQEGAQANGQSSAQANGQHGQQQGRRPAQYHYRERRVGRFLRQIALPAPVNADKAEATFEHGVLTLRLPKAEQARRKRIEVRRQPALDVQASPAPKELSRGNKAAKSGAKA